MILSLAAFSGDLWYVFVKLFSGDLNGDFLGEENDELPVFSGDLKIGFEIIADNLVFSEVPGGVVDYSKIKKL
jgi:hypothetical protein